MENFTFLLRKIPGAGAVSPIRRSGSVFLHHFGCARYLLRNSGAIEWECNKQNKFCNYFDTYKDPRAPVQEICIFCKLATQLGEPYVFFAKRVWSRFAVSLIISGQVLAALWPGRSSWRSEGKQRFQYLLPEPIHFDAFPRPFVFKNMKSSNQRRYPSGEPLLEQHHCGHHSE